VVPGLLVLFKTLQSMPKVLEFLGEVERQRSEAEAGEDRDDPRSMGRGQHPTHLNSLIQTMNIQIAQWEGYRSGSRVNEVVDIQHCPQCKELVQYLLQHLQGRPPYTPLADQRRQIISMARKLFGIEAEGGRDQHKGWMPGKGSLNVGVSRHTGGPGWVCPYKGDWMWRPIGNNEVAFLVRLLVRVSAAVNNFMCLGGGEEPDVTSVFWSVDRATFGALAAIAGYARQREMKVDLRFLAEKQLLMFIAAIGAFMYIIIIASRITITLPSIDINFMASVHQDIPSNKARLNTADTTAPGRAPSAAHNHPGATHAASRQTMAEQSLDLGDSIRNLKLVLHQQLEHHFVRTMLAFAGMCISGISIMVVVLADFLLNA